MTTPDHLTTAEAVTHTGLSERTLRKRTREGALNRYRSAANRRIAYYSRKELDALTTPKPANN